MKNKRGFTLTELLITITVMMLLSLVIGANMVGLLDKEKEKSYDRFKEDVEEAACVYIELSRNSSVKENCMTSGSCRVSIQTLIEQGLIDEDLEDPSLGGLANTSRTIVISYTDGAKTCKYEE